VTRRMQLTGLAFWHVWSVRRSQCITRTEDQCVECLGQTSTTLWLWDMGTECNYDREICALHRQHLRILAGYRWPKRIRNEALYRLTKSRPLSMGIQQSRLRLLGHCLCMPTDTLARLGLSATVSTNLKGRRGRPPKCLLSTLRTDMDKVGLNTRNMKGLEGLHKHAADKH